MEHLDRVRRTALARHAGFTLIELMITVAIVAILAAVAFPSYTAYIQRSRISDATGLLSMTRVRLEQFFQNNRKYGDGSTCGVAMPANANQFTVTCGWGSTGTNQTFLLTATGNANTIMADFAFTVDDANVQSTTAFPGASGLPANCWLLRKGQSC
jgi:type IV pilus assembly protein PilE